MKGNPTHLDNKLEMKEKVKVGFVERYHITIP
jgi:hypothetical protein